MSDSVLIITLVWIFEACTVLGVVAVVIIAIAAIYEFLREAFGI